jgi:site-specific DNA recombinase
MNGDEVVSDDKRNTGQPLLRILGYARESTREQAIEGFNLDEQERKIRDYVNLYYEDPRYEFTMIREEGASAKSLRRPEMKGILKQIKSGEIDILIIHNLDRLTRNLSDMQELLQLFEEHHIELISLRENIDTSTPQGRFFVSIIVLIAQWEEETIGNRAVRGKRESARQGNYAKSRVPFGYFRNPDDKKHLLINEEEAAVVRRIFQSLANQTHTPFTIAKELKNEKVFGRRWKDSSIEHLISNKIYYGTFAWYDEEFADHQPAIVSRELWELANSNAHSKEFSEHKYLFRNRVRCTKCHKTCEQKSTTKSNGTEYQYYVCPECSAYINEKIILRSIENKLNSLVQAHHMYKDVKKLLLKRQLLDGEMNMLVNGYTSQKINKAYYEEMMEINDEEKKYIAGKIADEEARIERMSFLALSDEEKEALMTQYIAEIKVDFKTKEARLHTTELYKRIEKYA